MTYPERLLRSGGYPSPSLYTIIAVPVLHSSSLISARWRGPASSACRSLRLLFTPPSKYFLLLSVCSAVCSLAQISPSVYPSPRFRELVCPLLAPPDPSRPTLGDTASSLAKLAQLQDACQLRVLLAGTRSTLSREWVSRWRSL
ncbi:hypothetical protein SKAU_G00161030 [Synaphobranchus kaupii]|uniref:Uncharacterized protein n=1 Tax=Synaphobranchus kaupii TaxID=118154 RepID=A0A9Q1FIP7_SYNKA|nr:hypothetical protein SKAU_G00161030 [Synaphobranchus kaupii]